MNAIYYQNRQQNINHWDKEIVETKMKQGDTTGNYRI
jgi:hypothetical protein